MNNTMIYQVMNIVVLSHPQMPYRSFILVLVLLMNSMPTLTGVGDQCMVPTSIAHFSLSFSEWEPLDVTNASRTWSMVARTNRCGWARSSSRPHRYEYKATNRKGLRQHFQKVLHSCLISRYGWEGYLVLGAWNPPFQTMPHHLPTRLGAR